MFKSRITIIIITKRATKLICKTNSVLKYIVVLKKPYATNQLQQMSDFNNLGDVGYKSHLIASVHHYIVDL